jgi:hypothetical protein
VPLKQEQLQRVLQTMQESFVVARQGGGALDIVSLYFGAEPSLQLKRLHEVMRLQMEAWGKLMERAISRIPEADRPRDQRFLLAMAYDMITPKELEDIVRIADPSSNEDGLDIDLPEALAPGSISTKLVSQPSTMSLDDIQKKAESDADSSADPDAVAQQTRIQKLADKAGLTIAQATSIIDSVDLAGTDLGDDDIAQAIDSRAKGKIDAVRRALKL